MAESGIGSGGVQTLIEDIQLPKVPCRTEPFLPATTEQKTDYPQVCDLLP